MAMLTAAPALPVRDVARAVAFYGERLGFAPRHVELGFAIVVRDGVEIHLWEANDPNTKGAEPFLAGSASCRIRVGGIRDLYGEYRAVGVVHPNGALQSRPWGDDDFSAGDADGNLLSFCEEALGIEP